MGIAVLYFGIVAHLRGQLEVEPGNVIRLPLPESANSKVPVQNQARNGIAQSEANVSNTPEVEVVYPISVRRPTHATR